MKCLKFYLSHTRSETRQMADGLIVSIAVAVCLSLFWSFLDKIRCFFTWKNSALTPVVWTNGSCACSSGASGLWNDQGPTPNAMCCRSKTTVNNWAKGWCIDMHDGDTCLFDDQCVSGYCAPGYTGDSKCSPKLEVHVPAPWDRNVCKSGKSALWNDRGNEPETRCCPTSIAVNNWAKGWCIGLPLQSRCIFDDQCISKNCVPGGTTDSICIPKKDTYEVAPWYSGKECKSGASALWNDRGDARESRCCPTGNVINNWAKGWCGDIPIDGKCIFNDQCTTKICRPEISSEGICVNTDFNKACSEHTQCKSEWCHAGHCK